MIKVIKAGCNAGKTSKAIEIAIERAKAGKNVLFINNEETQESICGRIMTDLSDATLTGDITVRESDSVKLSDLQGEIYDCVIKERFDVLVIDVNCYNESMFNSKCEMLEAVRSYFKKTEVAHNVDIVFTLNTIINDKEGKVDPEIEIIWEDTNLGSTQEVNPFVKPDPFSKPELISIDVTNASPFTDKTQRIIYQTITGEYVGKVENFGMYGFKK